MSYANVAGRSNPSQRDGEEGAPSTPTTKRNADDSGLSPPGQQSKANKQENLAKDKFNFDINDFKLDFEKKESVGILQNKIIELMAEFESLLKKCDKGPLKEVLQYIQLCMSGQFDILTGFAKIAHKNRQEQTQKDKENKSSKFRNDLKNDLENAAFDVKVGPIEINFDDGPNPSKQASEYLRSTYPELKDHIEKKQIFVLSKKDETKGKKSCQVIIKAGSLETKNKIVSHLKKSNSKLSTRYNFPSSVFPLVKRMRSCISKYNKPIKVENNEINLSETDKYCFMIRPTTNFGALRISYSPISANQTSFSWTRISEFQLPDNNDFNKFDAEAFLGIKNKNKN